MDAFKNFRERDEEKDGEKCDFCRHGEMDCHSDCGMCFYWLVPLKKKKKKNG